MFQVHLIEIDALVVGVVTRFSEGFRFLAIENSFGALEELIFESVETARRAAFDFGRSADPQLRVRPLFAAG